METKTKVKDQRKSKSKDKSRAIKKDATCPRKVMAQRKKIQVRSSHLKRELTFKSSGKTKVPNLDEHL